MESGLSAGYTGFDEMTRTLPSSLNKTMKKFAVLLILLQAICTTGTRITGQKSLPAQYVIRPQNGPGDIYFMHLSALNLALNIFPDDKDGNHSK